MPRCGCSRVVVGHESAQHALRVAFTADEHPVQALGPGCAHKSFGKGVRPGRPKGCLDGSCATDLITSSKGPTNLLSRSRTRKRKDRSWSSRTATRSRACWVAQARPGEPSPRLRTPRGVLNRERTAHKCGGARPCRRERNRRQGCQRPELARALATRGQRTGAPGPGDDGVGLYGPLSPRRSPRACGTRPRSGGNPSAGSPGLVGQLSPRPRRRRHRTLYDRDAGRSRTARRGPGASATAWLA
jgi:hypothetical protein